VDRNQAKAILLLYRPGTADENDPDFKVARDLAESDQELGIWFKRHCAVQVALRGKFAQIAVPDGLKEQILAEAKGHPAFGYRLAPVLLAACVAAILLVVGTFTYVRLRGPARDPMLDFRNHMAGMVQRQYPQMDLETNDPGAIKTYLTQKGDGNYGLPEALAKTAPTGCKLISWNSRRVTMICFNSGKATKKADPDLFLFVIDRSALANAPAPGSPQVASTSRRFATATWSDGDKTYVLGGYGDEGFIRRFL
jgi:hypothetical protein